MATTDQIPNPPQNLPAEIKDKWTARYKKSLEQAKQDYPDNPSRQRQTANREANALLKIAAPQSAADIDALERWQVIQRGSRNLDGKSIRFCVTIDGRKYSFPVQTAPVSPAAKK